jgi:hypothetical protein
MTCHIAPSLNSWVYTTGARARSLVNVFEPLGEDDDRSVTVAEILFNSERLIIFRESTCAPGLPAVVCLTSGHDTCPSRQSGEYRRKGGSGLYVLKVRGG